MRGGDCPGPSRPEANPTRALLALLGAHAPPPWGSRSEGSSYNVNNQPFMLSPFSPTCNDPLLPSSCDSLTSPTIILINNSMGNSQRSHGTCTRHCLLGVPHRHPPRLICCPDVVDRSLLFAILSHPSPSARNTAVLLVVVVSVPDPSDSVAEVSSRHRRRHPSLGLLEARLKGIDDSPPSGLESVDSP